MRRATVAYREELDVVSTSSKSDSLGVRITSGLGVVRAGSSGKAVGWTGFEKPPAGILQKETQISLVDVYGDFYRAEMGLMKVETNIGCCAAARELVVSTMATR